VRQATTTLDQLEMQYLGDQKDAAAAQAAATKAQALLAATQDRYVSLEKAASTMVVSMYVSNSIQENTLSQFMSNQTTSVKESIDIYHQIASANLVTEIATLDNLKQVRQQAAATATSQAAAAVDALDKASQALASAQASEARLLNIISTQDSTTMTALNFLETSGDTSIQKLLTAGGLTIRAGVATPPPVSAQAAAVVQFAAAQLGKPYLWGGNGPSSFDCSGLVQQAWGSVGVALPRVAVDQFNATVPVSYAQLEPGDLVFFESPVGHVGIYIGNGLMVDAPYTGAFVRVDSIYWKDLAGFGRVV
jgi:cell wall-associated NlpC family hydrolase